MSVILVSDSLWEDKIVNYPWTYFDPACGTICVQPVLYCFLQIFVGGCRGWHLSGRWNCCHVVGNEIVPFYEYGPGIVSVYQWDFEVASTIWVSVRWYELCFIQEN